MNLYIISRTDLLINDVRHAGYLVAAEHTKKARKLAVEMAAERSADHKGEAFADSARSTITKVGVAGRNIKEASVIRLLAVDVV